MTCVGNIGVLAIITSGVALTGKGVFNQTSLDQSMTRKQYTSSLRNNPFPTREVSKVHKEGHTNKRKRNETDLIYIYEEAEEVEIKVPKLIGNLRIRGFSSFHKSAFDTQPCISSCFPRFIPYSLVISVSNQDPRYGVRFL